ncbi:MAG: hypothetical protein C0432_02625 [Candidatus Puniceispirillum sp.]|nr:hypothetical protein [Candidatus Pelagibacter sp.]MBA4283170.1 hypothetical protein [Candidatus Puniceispirillum sp.]
MKILLEKKMKTLFTISILFFLTYSAFSAIKRNTMPFKDSQTCLNDYIKENDIDQSLFTKNPTIYLDQLRNVIFILISKDSATKIKKYATLKFIHLLKNDHINPGDKQNVINQIFEYLIHQIYFGNPYTKRYAQALLFRDSEFLNPSQSTINNIFENLFIKSDQLVHDYTIHNFFTNLDHRYLRQNKSTERSLFQRLCTATHLAPNLNWTKQDLEQLLRDQRITDSKGKIWLLNTDQLPYLQQYLTANKLKPIKIAAQIIYNEYHKITAAIVLSQQQTEIVSDQFLLILERGNIPSNTQSASSLHSFAPNNTTRTSSSRETTIDASSLSSYEDKDPALLSFSERKKLFERNPHTAENPQNYTERSRKKQDNNDYPKTFFF